MNPSTGTFCESCGKALPSAVSSSPRVTSSAGGFAGTEVGRTLQAAELKKQSGKAAGALLAVAVIQAVVGGIVLFALASNIPARLRNAMMVEVFGIALVFFGLYVWARKQPLPAAIVGLVVYVTLHVIYGIISPATLVQGIIVKVIIVAILVNAIQAGVKYRQLQRGA
jgi:hypothetical protein